MEFLPRAPDPEEIIIGDETDDDGDHTGCGDELGCKEEENKDIGLAANEKKQQEE